MKSRKVLGEVLLSVMAGLCFTWCVQSCKLMSAASTKAKPHAFVYVPFKPNLKFTDSSLFTGKKNVQIPLKVYNRVFINDTVVNRLKVNQLNADSLKNDNMHLAIEQRLVDIILLKERQLQDRSKEIIVLKKNNNLTETQKSNAVAANVVWDIGDYAIYSIAGIYIILLIILYFVIKKHRLKENQSQWKTNHLNHPHSEV